MTTKDITSIRVDYKHVDGWHIFTSGAVPGLYVASTSPEKAFNDVPVAVEKLLKLNAGIECRVAAETPFRSFLTQITQGVAKQEFAEHTELSTRRYALQACA